jgi:pimeloyl-ACP methyl ester carboxylesterase
MQPPSGRVLGDVDAKAHQARRSHREVTLEKKRILYLHGFASSGQSAKARYFTEKFQALPNVEFHAIDFNPTPEDFEYVTTTGLINRLRQYVVDHHLEKVHIIGSSFGGLVGLHYAHRFSGVVKMLLLAPALFWLSGGLSDDELKQWERDGAVPVSHDAFQEEIPVRYGLHVDGICYLEPIPPATPILIIHGRNDGTVPIKHSRSYAADFPDQVHLVELSADHDLNDHLEFIWKHAESFLLQATSPTVRRA